MTRQKVSLYPVLMVNFIGTLGFSIVLPFLVFLVARFGGNAIVYGLAGATYPLMQVIGAPILGRWSDIHGRRRILLLSQAGTLLSWIIFSIALFLPVDPIAQFKSSLLGEFTLTWPLIVIFVARALDGLTGGNISVANAYLADVTPDEERSRNFGLMGVSSNLGFVLGPAIASLLGTTRWAELLPVLAALLISLIATLLVGFLLPESNPRVLNRNPEAVSLRKVFGQEQRECIEYHDEDAATARQVLSLPRVPRLLLVYFVIFLAFNLFYTSWPVHAAMGLDWSVTETGMFFTALSLVMVIAQGPLLRYLSARVSEVMLVFAGNLLLAANFYLLMSKSPVWIWLAAVLFGLGNGVMWPSVQSLLSKTVSGRNQGAVQGLAGSLGSMASIIGLVAGGFIYEQAGAGTFVIPSILLLLVSFVALPLARR